MARRPAADACGLRFSMKPQQGDLLPDKNADRRRLSHEASRVVHLAFALIKYVPLAVKSCRLHFFRVGSTEEFASEAGTPLQIIITHLIAHVAHHRCSIQTAILRYNSVFLRTFCVPFSHSNIFTLGTSLPICIRMLFLRAQRLGLKAWDQGQNRLVELHDLKTSDDSDDVRVTKA